MGMRAQESEKCKCERTSEDFGKEEQMDRLINCARAALVGVELVALGVEFAGGGLVAGFAEGEITNEAVCAL
jgi:hypothetical protein